MAERQTGPLRIRKFPPIFLYGCVLWLGAVSLGVVSLQAQQGQGQQQGIVAEPNLQLFTVLAAVNAAGYDVGAGRPELAPMRYAVRRELAAKEIPSLPALRVFYGDHQLFDPSRDLGQYVSLALLLSGPNFELGPPSEPRRNLPPDVVDLQDMVPLIAAFYRRWCMNRPRLFIASIIGVPIHPFGDQGGVVWPQGSRAGFRQVH